MSARPEPVIKWFKNEVEIDNKADYEITYKNGRATLTIPEVFSEDAGSYVCVSTNSVGTARSTAELTVKRKCAFLVSCRLYVAARQPPFFFCRIGASLLASSTSWRSLTRAGAVASALVCVAGMSWFWTSSQVDLIIHSSNSSCFELINVRLYDILAAVSKVRRAIQTEVNSHSRTPRRS